MGRILGGGMASLLDTVRACRSAKALHVYLRYAEEVVIEVRPSLYAFVRNNCPEKIADDVLQEALEGIARGVRRFKGQTEEQFWSWCYTIARRKIADRLKAELRHTCVSLDAEETSRAIEAAAASQIFTPREILELKDTVALLDRLDAKSRDLLSKRFVLGWDFKTIGEDIGKSPDAARMEVSRSCARARKLLLEMEG